VFAEDQDVILDLIWISYERLRRGQDAAGHVGSCRQGK
jgi:hypothetical protein